MAMPSISQRAWKLSTKEYGTRVILSGSTAELVGGRFACERMGEIVVRGKQTSVTIFRLVLPGERAPAD